MVIIQISCLVWMLIIYSGHEICVNARDLCIQTRLRSQEKWEGEKEVVERKGGGKSSQCITLCVVEYFLINTQLCLQTL